MLRLLLGVLGLPAQWPQVENRIAGSASALPSVRPRLCVPVHPPFHAHCVGFSGVLVCWAESPVVCHGSLLVVDGRRETKAAFHSSVWLMCLLQVPVLCPESADSVQLEAWLSCSLWGPGEPPRPLTPKSWVNIRARN